MNDKSHEWNGKKMEWNGMETGMEGFYNPWKEFTQ